MEEITSRQPFAAFSLPPSPCPLSFGLYIHIPFCLSKCPYCGFYSLSKLELFNAFVEALLREICLVSIQTLDHRPLPPSFDTIYFGGGTPSVLREDQVDQILNQIRRYFRLTSDIDITFEINPGDGGGAYFQGLHSLGINRLSLGVQSLDDRILRFLGRRHTVDQARQSLNHARESGFKNLGLDLIYGIPGQDIVSWLETVERATAFSPEHLSCYELTIEENTPFSLQIQKGAFSLPGEETQRDFFLRTSEYLENRGYVHYEVSNFARGEDYFPRHNQKYWNHTPYIGLGPSAHSFNGARRWWNHRSVEKYIAALAAGNLPVDSFEDLTQEQKMLEKIYFGMRTRKGIDLEEFRREFRLDLEAEKGQVLSRLMGEGLITFQKGVLSPTRTGLAVADRLALI